MTASFKMFTDTIHLCPDITKVWISNSEFESLNIHSLTTFHILFGCPVHNESTTCNPVVYLLQALLFNPPPPPHSGPAHVAYWNKQYVTLLFTPPPTQGRPWWLIRNKQYVTLFFTPPPLKAGPGGSLESTTCDPVVYPPPPLRDGPGGSLESTTL